MRKLSTLFKCLLVGIIFCTILLSGCTNNCSCNSLPKKYVVYYTDNEGTHELSVTKGKTYTLEKLPQKFGYDFIGLFTEKEGGFKLVDETGVSVDTYQQEQNIVLYPQFKAKEYTLILDYQGAEITNITSLKVTYDSSITELPTNLSIENKIFTGWYTKENSQGVQVADKYGVITTANIVNEKVLEFSSQDNNLYLYAGFEYVKYNVTLHFENDVVEEMQIEHGTDIKNVVPETRIDGKSVLTWSRVKNDINNEHVFTGGITGPLDLYAQEYAPVIDFDVNGGKKIAPLVAKENTTITLPTPTKENYKFYGWYDEFGNAYTSTIMPTNSIIIIAKWQARLMFDENGGTEVSDISTLHGEEINLPVPKKIGFFFAGWYTEDKVQYDTKTMPSESVVLKAGWYKEEKANIIVVPPDGKQEQSHKLGKGDKDGPSSAWCKVVDLSKYVNEYNTFIRINLSVNIKNEKTDTISTSGIYVYNDAIISDANLQEKFETRVDTREYKKYTFEGNIQLKESKIYLCYYAYMNKKGSILRSTVYFKEISVDIYYPDTTKLYLD